jgi:hypothetical protein
LVVGFYSGALDGTGVTGVQFDLNVDGVDEIKETFTSAAAAKTWFTDNAFNLGSLASGRPLGADTLTLTASLTVDTDTAGSSFSGGLLVGDTPTAAAPHPASGRLAQAMAGFGASSAAAIASQAQDRSPQHPLFAVSGRAVPA